MRTYYFEHMLQYRARERRHVKDYTRRKVKFFTAFAHDALEVMHAELEDRVWGVESDSE
jgi:hypothetical protein